MRDFYRGKAILITGAAGTVGTELVRQVIEFEPAGIRLLDNNETELFFLGKNYRHTGKVRAFLGDVRDNQKLINIARGVDIIFHAAALKHVDLSEYNPFDAVQTNIIGVKNVVQAAISCNVPRVIFTSSDKAVNPTNVMGTSKLMGERIITAANIVNTNGHQVFSSVRFGNVLGSRGSVVPIFAGQILRGEAVTVTDARMTRFVMSIPEAATLVLEGAMLACGGEVFVTKMPVMRTLDLARAMIDLLAPRVGRDPDEVTISYIGANPGEKLFEELMTQEESSRTRELPNMFAIMPSYRAFYRAINYYYPDALPDQENLQPYISSSEIPMTIEEIEAFLERARLLEAFSIEKPCGRTLPSSNLAEKLKTEEAYQGVKFQ
jgi:FlaA1/EpsC-like NDP-sugar epimerase